MSQSYLEVTFRRGRPIAAYLYFPRREGDRTASTRLLGSGLVVDLASDGHPLGLEITTPGSITLERVNEALAELGADTVTREDLAPVLAA